MVNPNKWPLKYRFLLMAFVFFLVFFLNMSKAHATESAPRNENYGKEQLKEVLIDTLTSGLSLIGAAQSSYYR